MSLGRVSLITVVFILMMPFAFQGALSETPPSHENFEDAEKNLEILLALLEDSKALSEETLGYLVYMDYSTENISLAMAKAQELHKLLSGAEALLNNMEGEAASYEDLVEYLTSFQNLDLNMTSFIQYYIKMNENLTIVEDYFEDSANSNITAETALESLNNSELNIEKVKEKVDDIQNNTNAINQKGFSTVTLEELIIETKQLVDSDENTTKKVAELLKVIPNFLSIYVNKTKIAINDELTVYGYFYEKGSFKAIQNITVFIDDQILGEVSTNSTGKYELKKDIPLNHSLGVFELHGSTIYNGSLYISKVINITITKIPTRLTLSTTVPAYSPNQTVPISGRLVDYRDRPLAGENITLFFHNITITNISTDIEGYFNFEIDTINIPIGLYKAQSKFESNDLYLGNLSNRVNVSINIPTNIVLSILEAVIFEGENIIFLGQLIDDLENNLLSNMVIEIYIEENKVGEVITNNLGQYEYRYFTGGMVPGKYNVHSEFNPTELKWREANSNIITVEIREPEETTQNIFQIDRIINNLFLVILLTLIFLLPAVFYMKKKRPVPSSPRQTQRPSIKTVRKLNPIGTSVEKEPKESENFTSKLNSLKTLKNPRKAIIIGYQLLLRALEKYKVIKVEPSFTHLDIQQILMDKNFPQNDIRTITGIFEGAMYSNRPIESKSLDVFIIVARKIFIQARRTAG